MAYNKCVSVNDMWTVYINIATNFSRIIPIEGTDEPVYDGLIAKGK